MPRTPVTFAVVLLSIGLSGCIIVPTLEKPDAYWNGPHRPDLRFVVGPKPWMPIQKFASKQDDVRALLGKPMLEDSSHRAVVYGQAMGTNYEVNFIEWAFGPTECRTCYLLMQFDDQDRLSKTSIRYSKMYYPSPGWEDRGVEKLPDGVLEDFEAH